MSKPEIYSFPTPEDVSHALNAFVAKKSAEAIQKNGRFTISLSGGSLPKTLAKELKGNKSVDFSKWHVFLADERLVPLDHEDSNYLLCKTELFDHVPIPRNQIYTADSSVDGPEAAKRYTEHLKHVFGNEGTPSLDLNLLGIGPDGHTCSMFPGHALLKVEDKWIDSLDDSPKPPPKRITFTLPLLANADVNLFVVTGEGKASMIKKIVEHNEDLPAAKVRAKGKVMWFLDNKAAKDLTIPVSKYSL
ncbi:hypothetical protein DFS34DRAFT_645736 [Phlyctochytrium arcticum]|nr:hypothetical protein DFS34DRAFT_645736 [Phlyctochytrium arcticum]